MEHVLVPDEPVHEPWMDVVDSAKTPEENYRKVWRVAFDRGDRFGQRHPHPEESMGR